ncbi:MAG: two-component system response regulator [Vicinamibacterales bacterium]
MPLVLHPTDRPATVLLVDDEASVRTLFGSVLKVIGCRVLEAPNGERALRLLADDPGAVDVIFLDWRMPVMDGAAFCDQYRALACEAAKPIVAICSHVEDVGAYRESLRMVMPKPISIHDIVDIVQDVMSGGAPRAEFVGLPEPPGND